MQCWFAAAGVGHRPENSDKETTSLVTPSQPTSDGFKRPVCYPEIGPKANNPRSRILDRSVSAPSVCSHGSSQAGTVNRRAVKSEDSLPECSITLESEELPPPPPLFSDPVASANVHAAPTGKNGTEPCPSPTIPSQATSGQPAACFGLQKSKAEEETLSPESPVEGGASSLSDQQMKELAVPFPLEHVERDLVRELHLDFKTCKKPGNELFQKEESMPNADEPLCPKAASPLLADAEPSLGGVLSEGRGSTEGVMGLSSQEKRGPECVADTSRGETFMEVDAAERFPVAANDLSLKLKVSSVDANPECSIMEVELSKRGSSLPASPSPPVSDLMPPGSTGFESAAVSLSLAATSGGQLSDQAEDPCISLTSALKELHQLLVVSSKQDLTVSQHEDSPLLAVTPEAQAAENEISSEECECTHLDSQDTGFPFPERVGVEALAGMQSFAAGMESIEVRELHRSAESCEQDMLMVQESSALSSSGFFSSSTTLEQLQSGECCASSSQCLSSDHVLGHEASEESQPEPQVASQSTQCSFPEETRTSSTSSTDLQSPPNGPAELLPSPPIVSLDPAVSRLPIFPAADIDQIVGAGFTPQEASEALEHAGGNADLALLILLAKNIVVPT